ncbi:MULTISPECIES: hypothetical protein [Halocynthiibacter]|uniref:Uncharacterized protein n=1 Tax=Halocynthiibacter halioticoli TaxID=2986804 RepID=A0AAE3LS56_9RHOB|nr:MULTISPECIES: hypothetical protein [Halocynthiibacter]MCV6825403.1 hypothetical protein [Halocynthiibacter halioticoli]MCW4058404.1 hypothetical protein [Halocynthiibacter sp. SDUM655004]
MAKLLEADTAYLPLFQRLEVDLKAAEEQEHALERAMRWVAQDQTYAEDDAFRSKSGSG